MVFFFNDTATTEIYTLALHDALPICPAFYTAHFSLRQRPSFLRAHLSLRQRPAFYTAHFSLLQRPCFLKCPSLVAAAPCFLYCPLDRKSTRLNSSHTVISYAVFCLKKKNHILINLSSYHTTYQMLSISYSPYITLKIF